MINVGTLVGSLAVFEYAIAEFLNYSNTADFSNCVCNGAFGVHPALLCSRRAARLWSPARWLRPARPSAERWRGQSGQSATDLCSGCATAY